MKLVRDTNIFCQNLWKSDEIPIFENFITWPKLSSKMTKILLCLLLWKLLNANVKNLQSFDFIDPPKPDTIQKALEELSWLKMVKRVVNTENLQTSSNWELTAVGKMAARFPLEPRIAKALILSADLQCSEEVCFC